jgi:uncharacterized RDD family membrane protein YckC
VETVAVKKCPFCAEEVQPDARKCKHCGEWLVCQKCGSDVESTASFCSKCGSRQSQGAGRSTRSAAVPDGVTNGVKTAWESFYEASPNGLSDAPAIRGYANFWPRLGGLFLDGLILAIPLALIGALTAGIGALVLPWLYFSIMASSAKQATFGMMIMGTTITDLEGNRLSFKVATGRYFASILSGLILGIGYLVYFGSERKQTLHDQMAGTLILEKV